MRLFAPENPPFLNISRRANTHSLSSIRNQAGLSRGKEESVALGVLYLWHDHWHEAHEIAQAHEGQRDHDLLHGILHRREGDFGNADYWFRSAGLHPCFHLIAARVKGIKEMHPAQAHTLLAQGWDPPTFVEAIRKQKSKAEEGFLRAVQAVEIMTFHEWLERNP